MHAQRVEAKEPQDVEQRDVEQRTKETLSTENGNGNGDWSSRGKTPNHTTLAQISARWRFVHSSNVKFCSQVTFSEEMSECCLFPYL